MRLNEIEEMIYFLASGDISKFTAIRKIKIGVARKYYYLKKVQELNKILDDNAQIKSIR